MKYLYRLSSVSDIGDILKDSSTPLGLASNIIPAVCDDKENVICFCFLYKFEGCNVGALAFLHCNKKFSPFIRGKAMYHLIPFAEDIARSIDISVLINEVPHNLLRLATINGYSHNHISMQTWKTL